MSDQMNIDPQVYKLYDEFCHSSMSRRDFLARAATLSVMGSVSATAMAQALLPNYAFAQEVNPKDERIVSEYVTYDSPGGNSGKIKGLLVRPVGKGPFPAVLVVHENRGLNPYIEDVARRLAVAGFIALAPDALSAVGGYPGDDEEGKVMQAKLDQNKIQTDMQNGAYYLKNYPLSNSKLGAVGFCFGGGVVNELAVAMGSDLQAAVPFYGKAPKSEEVKKIKSKMLIHYAEKDDFFNSLKDAYEAALKKNNIDFKMYSYDGTQHGFHNYSTPRYNKEAASLAWERTIEFFKKTLS